jgi:hypothetical protein
MSATDDKLEILIGKFLDGEISPAEQRWLDDELQRNEEARELLEQLRTLNACSREAVAAELDRSAGDPEGILQRAWQQHERPAWRRVVRVDGRLRFAVGLAAGFVLGLMLHFVLVWSDSSGSAPIGPTAGPGDVPAAEYLTHEATSYPRPVMRSVDWYSFTDQTGNQWLVEGIREGSVRPAVYNGDL